MMQSLIDLRRESRHAAVAAGGQVPDTELSEAIKDSLLSHVDLDVATAAARGLAALGVRNGRLIFALFDILDQGHRNTIDAVATSCAALGAPNCPAVLVLGFWDENTGICAGAMPCRRDVPATTRI